MEFDSIKDCRECGPWASLIARNAVRTLSNTSLTQQRCSKTGFSCENLECIRKQFVEALADGEEELSRGNFKKLFDSKAPFFAELAFQLVDLDKNGKVSLYEFLDAVHRYAGNSLSDRIKLLFRIYDLDGDGLIQKAELGEVIRACMEENKLKFDDEHIVQLTRVLFEEADSQRLGAITYDAFVHLLQEHNGLLETLTLCTDQWFEALDKERSRRACTCFHEKFYKISWPYMKNNCIYMAFLFCYISINIGLFVSRSLQFKDKGTWLYVVARACGQCLNFNCMFVLVLVLRQCITFLRSNGASAFLPLDQHLYLHKVCGWVIFFHSVLHTVMHLINFTMFIAPTTEVNNRTYSAAEWLFTMKPGLFGLIPGIANLSGIILMILLTVMVVCSLPFVRKSGCFEVFYWTHLLYIAFFSLTLLHAPHFWQWFVGPGVIYIIERVYRLIRLPTDRGKTYISSGVLLPSEVIHLVIKRPVNLHFHPGDYVFVNIPTIAKYEWHPFTISSAPEQQGELWLHIKAVGEWTKRLRRYFEREHENCERRRLQRQRSEQSSSSLQTCGGNSVTLRVEENLEMTETREEPLRLATLPTMKTINEVASSDNGIMTEDADGTNGTINPVLKQDDIDTKASPGPRVRKKNCIARCGVQSVNERILALREEMDDSFELYRESTQKPKRIELDIPSDVDTSDSDDDSCDGMHSTESIASLQVTDLTFSSISPCVEEGSISNPSSPVQTRKRTSRRQRRKEIILAEGGCMVEKPLVIYIDGPFGTPSSHIFRAQHAVLIAAGIGVTPFASILQSIMHKYWTERHTCPKCLHSWTAGIPKSVMKLKKVDFFWINREQKSFQWFVDLLSQLEREQEEKDGPMERFLDLHMYITSDRRKTDMKSIMLQLALNLVHEKEKKDLITGLRTKMNPGRPNFDKIFKQLQREKKGKVTVFFCGPPSLGQSLRVKCDYYGFNFRKEVF